MKSLTFKSSGRNKKIYQKFEKWKKKEQNFKLVKSRRKLINKENKTLT